MNPQLEADILAASQPLRLPGAGERRVLTPAAVERLAAGCAWPRWKLEALAVELDVLPLHYLRNLAQAGREGLVRLLRASVAVVGEGPVVERGLELLALGGLGRLTVLVPVSADQDRARATDEAGRLAAAARNRNASSEVSSGTISLKDGNPVDTLRGADVVAACMTAAADEQLLQFACRMLKVPVVFAAAEDSRGHATTVLPGDRGIAVVYRPSHPHLESMRSGEVSRRAGLMVGTWLQEQVQRLVLGEGDLLRDRILYADLDAGAMEEHPL